MIVYLQLKVQHKTDTENPYGMVNYWINESDSNKAYQIASNVIEDKGWKVTDIQQAMLTDRNSYSDPAHLEFYEKALADGQAYEISILEPQSITMG